MDRLFSRVVGGSSEKKGTNSQMNVPVKIVFLKRNRKFVEEWHKNA
jgi:hypothetical protein